MVQKTSIRHTMGIKRSGPISFSREWKLLVQCFYFQDSTKPESQVSSASQFFKEARLGWSESEAGATICEDRQRVAINL